MILENKVALVTGASHGIGKAIAIALAAAGADVALSYRSNRDGAEGVAKSIEAKGRRAHVIRADLSIPSESTRVATETIEVFGRLDVLVNNAGGSLGATDLLSLSIEKWRYAFDLNVTAALLASQVAVPRMIERGNGGSIINISSVHSSHVWPNDAAYGVAKAALNRLTKGMGLEWARYGIRANAIAPGYVNTSETDEEKARYEATDNRSAPLIAAQRTATTSEIAEIVVFLASAASSYITGQTIFADGGLLLPPITTADFMRGDRTGQRYAG
jgi:NAD(P)-dependent dehydrogenase (short-subunit alcohol dehydrogenase family)